jgi:hypothetical protein
MGRSKRIKSLRHQVAALVAETEAGIPDELAKRWVDGLPLIGPWLYGRRVKRWSVRVDLARKAIETAARQAYQAQK